MKKSNIVNKIVFGLWAAFLLAGISVMGCGDDSGGGDSDSDSDGDSDSDSDGDADADSDTDADTDSDSDGDCVPSSDISPDFSFFVMSLEKIKEWSLAEYGDTDGLGGDLGGLAGADAKCQEAAEDVGSCKKWHAFLSVTDDGTGNAVNAIDRIGEGPWYDVNGYRLADDVAGLLNTRPDGDTTLIWTNDFTDNAQWPFNQCLTTELGNCNHSYGDTHDTVTGTNRQGQLISTDSRYTCSDWTTIEGSTSIPIGHTWPRQLNSTNDDDANWIYSHSIPMSGGPGGGGSTATNGCGRNINIAYPNETFEDGIGGDGGYGAWYCFAYED